MNQQLRVELTPDIADGGTRWSARINGITFPVEAFGLEHNDDRVLVSLVINAGSVQIGKAVPPAPAVEKPKVSVWGDSSLPDPRESLPGWVRPVSADVAQHAAPRSLDTIRQEATA